MKNFGFLLLFVFSSCSVFDNEQNLTDTQVLAIANNPVLSVLNKSEKPIIYLVFETNLANVIDLADPCTEFTPNLAARSNTQINYSDIAGWEQEAESVWFFWTDCNGNGSSKTINL